MERVHSHHHGAKRRRLDETIEPCMRQTVEHGSMSISSLIDQKPHHHHNSQSTEHSSHTYLQTRNSATTNSSAPFNLLEQSNSPVAQPSEAPYATPAQHSRPWEIFNSYNPSLAHYCNTSTALWNPHNAATQSFQARDLVPNTASDSYTTASSPYPDLSSEDGFQSFEDEFQDPNITVSQANTEQNVMVCFGMVSYLV